MDSKETATRLGESLIRTGWPKDKLEAAKVKAEVEAAQAAADEQRKLKLIRQLAAEIKYLTLGSCRDRWQRIAATVDKIKELL